MKSLQGRMLVVLGATIALCWVVALAMLVVYLKYSESSVWDSKLEAIAVGVLLATPAKEGLLVGGEASKLHDNAARPKDWEGQLAPRVQVWIDRHQLAVRSPGAPALPLRPDFADGVATTVIDGEQWRVYSLSDSTGHVHVQVGSLVSWLDGRVQSRALVAPVFGTALLALVGGLMWIAVRRSLKPVTALEKMLRGRKRFDFTPLSVADLPAELKPLVASFNHLLDQLDKAVEGERRFIGDAAHELRTPLSALQAQVQVAMQESTLAQKDAALDKLLLVVQRSARLSEQLLDLARLNAGFHAQHRGLADLSELVLHVAREFEMHARRHDCSIFLAIETGLIECNIDEIGILLRNLVDNALCHTPRGARVRISCGQVLDMASGLASVFLEVADDGPGVPEAEHRAIFRRFHRVAGNSSRGSGIGLSLVEGIAHLHQASVQTGKGLDGRGFSVRLLFPQPASGPSRTDGRGDATPAFA